MPNQYTEPRSVIVPIGPSIAYVPLTRGQYALIDSDNAGLACQWSASWNWSRNSFYARRGILAHGKRSSVYMHREIMGSPEGMAVDHINMNTLDNRRCNLRIATHSENCCNSKVRPHNLSGLKGVYRRKNLRRWRSSIRVAKTTMHLGYFDTPEAAHRAYCEAAEKYHGEFWRKA